MNITFKRFGTEITKEFDNNNDLIEFVILSGIKDEELVSIDLGGNTITGGIDGLASYALNKIAEDRKAAEVADEETFIVDIYDNQNNKVDFVEIDASSAEEAELIAENDYCAEDEYAVVRNDDCCDDNCCCGHCTCNDVEEFNYEHYDHYFVTDVFKSAFGVEAKVNGKKVSILFDADEMVKIIRQGYKLTKSDNLTGYEIIEVKATRLDKGDIIVIPDIGC